MNEKQKPPVDSSHSRNGCPGCISPENLSAELDGEYQFTPSEKVHLAQCPRCRGLYDSYRVLDDAVSNALNVSCPLTARYRIRKNVTRKIESKKPLREHKGVQFSAWVARIAATAVLFIMAGYLVLVDNPFSQELIEKKSPSSVSSTEQGRADSAWTAAPEPYSGYTGGGVDIRNLRLASAGDRMQPIEFAGSSAPNVKAENVILIPAKIKHIWLCDPQWTTARMEKVFRTALEKSSIPLKNVKLQISADGIRAQLELNRYQTVTLTRMLANQKLSLISSAPPQPEQKVFAGNGREIVDCEVVMARRGR